ncbi:MAG: AAA family ATPase [Oscillospiraceae bacterium]|nr:AAA family ATPase [Oscillospiraceae bacterium]
MSDIIEILDHIDPAKLDYQEWINVGMALKDEGYSSADWDIWSSRDRLRYHSGDCEKKWQSFNGSAAPVTAGTIIQYAKNQGWRPSSGGRTFDWDDEIIAEEDCVVTSQGSTEGIKLSEPSEWHPGQEIIRYLETLFEVSENVGYVTETWEKAEDGKTKYLPTKGSCTRTAGELIDELNKHGDDIGAVLGDYNPAAGAWIRFNPLDGKGIKNENVTDYRYALVESDCMALEEQNSIMRELELPIAILVYSGSKSIHAIVKVDAPNYEEYRKRVDYLYNVCRKNGLDIDKQNRNPSRLSRLPGIMRNGKKQYIIDTNIGKESFAEWKDWIESINDELPDPENLSLQWENLPQLAPPLIENVLRQGHKMLIAGPSKAGKSYALIELCAAIAEGKEWLGFRCAQGKVMYVNLELDSASCLHRFKDVYTAMNLSPENISNIDIWNLRGKSVPMDKLAPKLIRRASKKDYIAIIIDPIYKIITGDENSADQMAHFCNQFDKVCSEVGCAVIYCHHHSKGAQGGKRSMDRASGSGVFARDPDALLDLTQLVLTDGLIKSEENDLTCKICLDWISRFNPDFKNKISQDDTFSSSKMREHAHKELSEPSFKLMCADIEKGKESLSHRTAWRIEGTLREFASFAPINCWFDYPIHKADKNGALSDLKYEDDKKPWEKATEKKKKTSTNNIDTFINAYNSLCIDNEPPTMQEVATLLGKPLNTVRDWAKKSGYKVDKETGRVILT